MADDSKPPANPSARRRPADRRAEPRYPFSADAEIFEERSGTRIEARIADISERGCQAETNKPLPLGTEIKIRINKGGEFFSASARVVHASGKSLGLAFSAVTSGQVSILETWLGPSREQDWLTLNRRRTQRILVSVPVRVSAQGSPASRFEEDTVTLAINAHGASILLSRSVNKGQRLEILNIVTGDKAECIVAHLGQRHSDGVEVGVEFILLNPKFWRVSFPPEDWAHPVPRA